MSFRDYAGSKAVTLCFLGIGALLFAAVMAVAGANGLLIGMSEILFVLLVMGWLAWGFGAERARQKKLERIIDQLQDKYLLGEVLPHPAGAVETYYFEVMKTVSRSAIGVAELALREKEEYCEYVEAWIHEIKTPLTACSLILSNDGEVRKLKRELKRADNLTESILYYARMRTAEKDTQIRQTQIAQVIDYAVKSQMDLLIAAKISVAADGDFTVHTDAKALCFMIKQLLINCAKYCPGCQVTIRASQGTVTVEDNGIGIPQHELRRVTERGFTGTNGRKFGGSTGMGLYLVSGLCCRLGISLTVASEQGKYTRIALSFDELTKS